ncbi:MAG TPA: hypothetical protein VGZ00_02530 [Candidatus Baltobacteraceae bacterium]|jgi:hypothetical protein|nr:hypothetical protein [Candidatus Baltobacteraceae bacterium]
MLDRRSLGCLLALGLACASAMPTLADDVASSSQEKVVLAKTVTNALLIWDATPDLVSLEQEKVPSESILTTLESRAAGILQEKASVFAATADTGAIRIIYQKIGAVSPVYGTPTFEGVERLATLSASTKTIEQLTKPQIDSISQGKDPAGVKIDVTGKLP